MSGFDSSELCSCGHFREDHSDYSWEGFAQRPILVGSGLGMCQSLTCECTKFLLFDPLDPLVLIQSHSLIKSDRLVTQPLVVRRGNGRKYGEISMPNNQAFWNSARQLLQEYKSELRKDVDLHESMRSIATKFASMVENRKAELRQSKEKVLEEFAGEMETSISFLSNIEKHASTGRIPIEVYNEQPETIQLEA